MGFTACVVNDNSQIRQSIAHGISRIKSQHNGSLFVVVHSYASCEELLQSRKPHDLYVIDNELDPSMMSGLECATILRRLLRTPGVPNFSQVNPLGFIVLTTTDATLDVEGATKAGVDHVHRIGEPLHTLFSYLRDHFDLTDND